MSRETLHESISAVMDSEADELELRRVLGAMDDPQEQAMWARYQIARAALHRELMDPQLDLLSGISARLAEDEKPSEAAYSDSKPEAIPRQGVRSLWSRVGRMAIAASVTCAVLVGVRFYNQNTEVTTLASQPTETAAPVAVAKLQVEPSHRGAEVHVVSETLGSWKEPRVQQAIQPASFTETKPVTATHAAGQ